MQTRTLLGTALALALASLPAATARAMTQDEAATKAIAFIEAMAAIVDKDKESCDTMAADLNRYQDDNAALIKELQEMKAKRTPEDRKAFQEKYAARLKAAQEKMMTGGVKCEKNEKVKAALQRMR